ncbi:hypothetical protein [Paenibacillus pini]
MVLYISLVLVICVVTACEKTPANASLEPKILYGDTFSMQGKREKLHQFVIKSLSGPDGVYTNYLDTDQSADVATGHEILSESAGIMMRYYALTKQKEAFEAEWVRTKKNFNLNTGFSYRYSPKQGKKYPLNAAVDDMRIIRALHEGAASFKDSRYTKEADTFGSRFYQYNVKNGYLYDFYDENYKITNSFVTLCYVNLQSLQELPISSTEEQQLMKNMQDIIRNGYLSDDFPFYETRYQYDTKSYSSDHINTVESLLTILELAEVQQQNPASIRYLKEQVKAGTLYGQYTRDGKPTNDIQSTAIYAIAAMIGSELKDRSLYEDSIGRMNEFQVKDESSAFKGGFGDTASKQAYSFDNLMALLAYAY